MENFCSNCTCSLRPQPAAIFFVFKIRFKLILKENNFAPILTIASAPRANVYRAVGDGRKNVCLIGAKLFIGHNSSVTSECIEDLKCERARNLSLLLHANGVAENLT